MSNYANIALQLATIIDAADGIDNVFVGRRHLRDSRDEFFQRVMSKGVNAPDELQYWVVYRTSVELMRGPNRAEGVASQTYRTRHNFTIEGWMGYDGTEEREDEIQKRVDVLLEALVPHLRINNMAFTSSSPGATISLDTMAREHAAMHVTIDLDVQEQPVGMVYL